MIARTPASNLVSVYDGTLCSDLLSDFEARREDAQEEARAIAERLLDQ
jgi:hypothetical protein